MLFQKFINCSPGHPTPTQSSRHIFYEEINEEFSRKTFSDFWLSAQTITYSSQPSTPKLEKEGNTSMFSIYGATTGNGTYTSNDIFGTVSKSRPCISIDRLFCILPADAAADKVTARNLRATEAGRFSQQLPNVKSK